MVMSCTIQKELPKAVSDSEVLPCTNLVEALELPGNRLLLKYSHLQYKSPCMLLPKQLSRRQASLII